MAGQQLTFYEFFAGGGMVRAGLGGSWTCLFANDNDTKKAASYGANWGTGCLKVGDVSELETTDVPGQAALAWASFPCQDLSLAGNGAGLRGKRSGTFWPFWRLMKGLSEEGRPPLAIVLENVCGTLSSHGGRDFAAIADAATRENYRIGALVMDAARFLPQSRPRLFLVCAHQQIEVPNFLTSAEPDPAWHPPYLTRAHDSLPPRTKSGWVWWHLPSPKPRKTGLSALIEERPSGIAWHTPEETEYLLSLMSPTNRKKVELAKRMRKRVVGTVYRRTRRDEKGDSRQRAEVRFDDISGCLRTPVGGSSRQTIIVVEGQRVLSRLISSREAARLMGLPDSYKLPQNYNEAYHLVGDGVAVPAVHFLATNILERLLEGAHAGGKQAA